MIQETFGFLEGLDCLKLDEFLEKINKVIKNVPEEFKSRIDMNFSTKAEDCGTDITFSYLRKETEQELKAIEEGNRKIKERQELRDRYEFERLSKKFAKTT